MKSYKVFIAVVVTVIIVIIGIFINSASFKRSVVDLKSNLTGGLNREINVYTADGQLI